MLKINEGYFVVQCLLYCYHRIIVRVDFNRCKWLKAIRIRTSHIIIVQMFLSRDKRQMTTIVCFCIINRKKKSMQMQMQYETGTIALSTSTTKFMTATHDEIHKTNWFIHWLFFFLVCFVHFCACRYTAVKRICLFVGYFIVHSGSELTAGFVNCIFINISWQRDT